MNRAEPSPRRLEYAARIAQFAFLLFLYHILLIFNSLLFVPLFCFTNKVIKPVGHASISIFQSERCTFADSKLKGKG